MSVDFRVDGDVAVMTMQNPPVNALGQSLRQGLKTAMAEFAANDSVQGGVLIGDGRGFSAGADITEFGKPPQDPPLSEVLAALESSPKPVVAAIHGIALGGGLELALCCHYRVADRKARIGLPEVKIGLIPGAGGTQRLPRLTGVETAIDVITSGRMVPADEAKAAGVVSAVYDADLEASAVAFIRNRLASGGPHPAVRDLDVPDPPDASVFDERRKALARRARGQLSPLRCVDAVQAACELDFDAGIAREREIFLECMASPQREGLIHYFFAEREAAKIPGLSPDAAARPVDHRQRWWAAAPWAAASPCASPMPVFPVTVRDSQPGRPRQGNGLRCARTTSVRCHAAASPRHRWTSASTSVHHHHRAGTDIADADIVIEAVFENLDLKCKTFAELDKDHEGGGGARLPTPPPLDVDKIGAATKRPQDVIGMHFFSPANVMKLCEVVRSDATADDVIKTAMDTARRIGKVSALVGVCDGFVGNRMLHQYQRQASAT